MFQELSDLDRIHLVLALQAAVSRDATHRRDTGWADELARRVGTGPTSHALTKSQVASALEYQRVLTKFSSYSDALPSWRQLLAVGVASGVPFIGFGIIDNGIMVCREAGRDVRGEETARVDGGSREGKGREGRCKMPGRCYRTLQTGGGGRSGGEKGRGLA